MTKRPRKGTSPSAMISPPMKRTERASSTICATCSRR
nr:MAG TPA: hypothetical protein [Bacteriophage sp.]